MGSEKKEYGDNDYNFKKAFLKQAEKAEQMHAEKEMREYLKLPQIRGGVIEDYRSKTPLELLDHRGADLLEVYKAEKGLPTEGKLDNVIKTIVATAAFMKRLDKNVAKTFGRRLKKITVPVFDPEYEAGQNMPNNYYIYKHEKAPLDGLQYLDPNL